MRRILLIFFLLCFNISCNTLGPHSKSNKENNLGRSTQIIDPQRLQQGGNLIIFPFSVGVQVSSTDQTDKVSLMIVKGFAESISTNTEKIKIVWAKEEDKANFLLKGRITKFDEIRGFRPWFFRKNRRVIEVEGKIFDRDSNQTVAVFADRKEAADSEASFEELGSLIGKDMAEVILMAL